MKLSAIIIAKNEEKKIKDCLDSLSFCDEIILIDSGSTDATIDVAKKHKATIFTHKSENFAEMRNFALTKSSGEWIFYVDADERVTKSLQKEVLEILKSENVCAAYKVKRKNFYFHTVEWPKIEKLERLFKKSALKEWYGELHETPKVDGEVGLLSNYLIHYTHDDLSSMVNKTNKWSEIEARLRFDSHHPRMTLWRFPRVMVTAFIDSYIEQGGWKKGTAGLVEGIFQAFSMFITYAKLWELQNQKK